MQTIQTILVLFNEALLIQLTLGKNPFNRFERISLFNG